MVYRLLADIILIIHLCYILFVISGGFLMLRWRWIWKLHLPAVIWGFLVQYFIWICPLTNWENYFRKLGGEVGYQVGFIDYFITLLIYQNVSTEIHYVLAISLVSLNFLIYLYIFFRPKKLI